MQALFKGHAHADNMSSAELDVWWAQVFKLSRQASTQEETRLRNAMVSKTTGSRTTL
jgi:hypothetical protein